MNFSTINKKLAVKPLENKGAKAEVRGGLALLSQSLEVAITELVFDFDTITDGVFQRGSRIAFSGESCAKDWNRRVFTLNGQQFVLAPMDEVLMVGAPETERK